MRGWPDNPLNRSLGLKSECGSHKARYGEHDPRHLRLPRVSKSDRDDRNLETQLRELANHGIYQELTFSDVMTGRLMSRPE